MYACLWACMYACIYACMFALSLFSHTKCTHVPDRRKLPHGILEITPPVCQGSLMPKRFAQRAQNLLPHSNAKNTPRVDHSVQCFPLFRAPLSVGEIMFGELKYNIIPIVHTRAGKLPHLKWTCLMLGIYGGKGCDKKRWESIKGQAAGCSYNEFDSDTCS